MTELNFLVIDDEKFDREILSKILTSKFTCKIFEAENLTLALNIILSNKIDLIFLDVEIPNVNTGDFILSLREKSNLSELPIIMISGVSKEDVIIKCLKFGANDYILKPIKIDIAVSRIKMHIKLIESVKDMLKFQRLLSINAMIVTYNHEINNPLSIAIGKLSSLKKDSKNEIIIKKIESELWRIANIIKKIEGISQSDEINIEKYANKSDMIKLE
ncbi:MAG: response regulator [Silvanigrellaceae bacterium]|nr:response regulator [Silvanigrellaceae bacterium]